MDPDSVYDLALLTSRVKEWTKILQDATTLVAKRSPSSEPYKNIYAAIESAAVANFQVDAASNVESIRKCPQFRFWVRFTKIHVLSCLAKWYEMSEELGVAEANHVQCLELIEKELGMSKDSTEQECTEEMMSSMSIVDGKEQELTEWKNGLDRVKYMYIYELTRYAILCSERDDQDKALELLKKAETYYHDQGGVPDVPCGEMDKTTMLGMLDSLNAESSKDMFTYVLFYLGQAYKIRGEKERAILYLHMVLRRQLEKGDYSTITWGSDSAKMATVLMANSQAYETARDVLVAATVVMKSTKEEEKTSDNFKENWAELGRTWAKFGVQLLEFSADRLKDIEESQNRKQVKFATKLSLDKHEKLSLGMGNVTQTEFDTVLLIRALKFPSLDVKEVDQSEMKGGFARDFDEARQIFLCSQRWINVAKEYYTLNEFAGDYVGLMTDYQLMFKHLAFFEPSLDRQIKMQKRRIGIIEDLVTTLNPRIYQDVCHELLRELAETYERVYKLKVEECKDQGKSLRPKDKKLVQWLVDAVGAHKRNLQLFDFDLNHPEKSFPEEYEKILMACVMSIGRILGSICHDHPLHSDAADLGEESKKFYTYFLQYLDRRIDLKREFISLYEGSQDMPDLLDSQIRKIRHHHRIRSIDLR